MHFIQCPDCKESWELQERFDEDLSKEVQCPACGFTASMFSFNYIIEVDEVPLKTPEAVQYELGPGGMLVPFTETGEDSDGL